MGTDHNFMRVFYCMPGEKPKILKIRKSLEGIAELMKTQFFDTTMYKDMILIFDPKGILKYSKKEKINDLNIRGPFIFCGNDEIEQDFKSLNLKQIKFLEKQFIKEIEIEEIEMEE